MTLRPFLFVFVAMTALGAPAAQAEVRIMMRPGPGSPVAAPEAPPPVVAPVASPSAPASAPAPAPAPALAARTPAQDAPLLRRGDADAPVSETAAELAPSAPPPAARAALRDPPRPAPDARAAVPVPSPDAPPTDRRAASLFGAAAPAPVSSARRRNQSPDEFRDRCTTDGGLMQGGGKYGVCVIR